jgi:hypothetical protein
VWRNVSDVPAGWNFYQLTTRIANVQATFSPLLNEHLVTEINGVKMNGPYSWGLWLFCQDKTAWVYSAVGADLVVLTNKSTLAWVYERDTNQPPLSGEAMADSC